VQVVRAALAVVIVLALVVPEAAVAGVGASGPRPLGAATPRRSVAGATIHSRTSARPTAFAGDVRHLRHVASRAIQPGARPVLPGPSVTKTRASGAGSPNRPAPSTQSPAAAERRSPSPSVSFKGLDRAAWGAGIPPDTTGDVGPNHYVQAVNSSVGIFSKTGTRLAAFTYDSLFSAAATGTECDDSNQGDPTVVYDQMADRWIIGDFAFSGDGTSPPFYECLAISRSGDPINGGWWFYAIRTDDAAHPWLADYPKMGIWPDGLYMTANMFDDTDTFQEVRIWAFNRADLYDGLAARMVVADFNKTSYYSLMPSNLRGDAPPAGRPNLLVSESQTAYKFQVFKFHVDYVGGGSTLTGPTKVSQTAYAAPPATVPSPGNPMDSLGDRVMQWAQYRNFAGTESLWVSHSVRTSSSGPTGIQWAQINVTGGTVATSPVQQQIYGNLGSDGVHRWMGSLAVDKDNNMALGYSASKASLEPDIRYNARLASDPLNTLPQGERSALSGVARGHQAGRCGGVCDRWGDYSSMSIDPDGCAFWYTQQYYEMSGLNWQTRIASFAFPTCTPITPPTISMDNSTGAEGNSGSTTRTFTVSLSGPAINGVHVDFATADGTATTADSDYVARSGTLQFDAGETTRTIDVTVNGDTTIEPDETFAVSLSNPSGASIAGASGTGTITNDDDSGGLPILSIDDVTHDEGNAGTTTYTFTVGLSAANPSGVTVDYSTADGTATAADADYTPVPPTQLAFGPSETSKQISVDVIGDTTIEPSETFTLNLSNAAGAVISDPSGTGTLANDDLPWAFNWSAPVVAPPAKNKRVAGSVISVRFTLGGDRGLNILAADWPKSKRLDCRTGALSAKGRTRTQPLGGAGLTYDSGTGVYTYTWQTAAGWAATCREFQMRLTDGSYHVARFKFRRP
jgi:hypothetical protein